MSKSVDETVFDFFSVLLQEPSTDETDAKILAEKAAVQLPIDSESNQLAQAHLTASKSDLNTDRHSNLSASESTNLTDSQERITQSKPSVLRPADKESMSVGENSDLLKEQTLSARQNNSEPTVRSFAQPQVDKDALSKLLSAVSKPNTLLNSAASVQERIKKKAEQVRLKLDNSAVVQTDKKVEQLSTSDNKDLKNSADIVTSKVFNTDSKQEQEDVSIPETALSSIPPSITTSLQEVLDDEFQVLFFNVAGLTLAVPLVSLGGIVKIEHINHLIGRPKWFLGVQTRREQTVNVVDSCQWVMPEKYTKELADSVNYQYIVMLEGSDWGFACESLVNSVKINKNQVNWREKAGKRPWLAGVVKEQMCGILNVQALIGMLDAGLGCQDSID